MAGYSGTPLAQKLGIKEGSRVFASGAPDAFAHTMEPWPAGAIAVDRVDAHTDLIHIFEKSRAKLAKTLATNLRKMRQDAAIWVSWPKKASKVPTDITEDVIREIALPMGLVDVKVCAVDETWSGLKLVIRKELRKPRK